MAQYLKVTQTAAFTGELPILDAYGNATGKSDQLNATQRIDLFKYLTNKSLPDRAPTPEQIGRDETVIPEQINGAVIEDMSDEQIRRILYADYDSDTVAEFSLAADEGVGAEGAAEA